MHATEIFPTVLPTDWISATKDDFVAQPTQVTSRLPQSCQDLYQTYWADRDPKYMAGNPLYAFADLFNFSAASVSQFLDLVRHEVSLEVSTSSRNPDRTVQLLGMLRRHKETLNNNIAFVNQFKHAEWPSDGHHTYQGLLNDFHGLIRRVEELEASTVNAISLTDPVELARVGAQQAAAVKILTVVTVIFLPLSFVTSFVGMNVPIFIHNAKATPESYAALTAVVIGLTTALLLLYGAGNLQPPGTWKRLRRAGSLLEMFSTPHARDRRLPQTQTHLGDRPSEMYSGPELGILPR